MRKTNKQLVLNLVLLLFTLIILFAGLELVVRFLNLSASYGYPLGLFQNDENLDYRMSSGINGTFVKQEFAVPIYTNTLGLRDHEYYYNYGITKPDDVFRILALGDSFTWGAHGTTLDETFVKVLEAKLNQNVDLGAEIKKVEVVNAGVRGYSPDQEVAYLKTNGLKLTPDLVTLNFYVNNDFSGNGAKGEMRVNDKGQLVLTRQGKGYIERTREFILEKSHAYRLMEKGVVSLSAKFIGENVVAKVAKWDTKKELFAPLSEDFRQDVKETYTVLEEANNLLLKKGVDFVIVLIPAKYQVDDKLWDIFLDENNFKEGDVQRDRPQEIIKKFAEKRNILVIDLLPSMQENNNDNNFFWNLNPHFNKLGNEVAGEIIFEELKKTKFIKEIS